MHASCLTTSLAAQHPSGMNPVGCPEQPCHFLFVADQDPSGTLVPHWDAKARAALSTLACCIAVCSEGPIPVEQVKPFSNVSQYSSSLGSSVMTTTPGLVLPCVFSKLPQHLGLGSFASNSCAAGAKLVQSPACTAGSSVTGPAMIEQQVTGIHSTYTCRRMGLSLHITSCYSLQRKACRDPVCT